MALIPCYECSREISDKAPACPHCGAPKEEQPSQVEEVEILESVTVEDEPAPTTQEPVSAPTTEPEPVAEKDERFNHLVAFAVGVFVFQIARALELQYGAMTVVFMLGPWWLLHKFGKKQSAVGYWVTFIWLGLFYWLSLTDSEVESVDIWRFAILIPLGLGYLCYGRIEKLFFWWKPLEEQKGKSDSSSR